MKFTDIRELYIDKQRVKITENKCEGIIIYKEHLDTFGIKDDMKGVSAFFKGCYVKYVLHMPGKIVNANTDEIYRSVAVWDIPLEKIGNEGLTIIATAKPQNKILIWFAKIFWKVKEQFK